MLPFSFFQSEFIYLRVKYFFDSFFPNHEFYKFKELSESRIFKNT